MKRKNNMSPGVTLFAPRGERVKYVSLNHPFMLEAKQACETLAGDSVQPMGVCVVKNGTVLLRAGNGYSRGPMARHICPRVVLDIPTGTGYELCPEIHAVPGHAEQMAYRFASEAGHDLRDADIYCYGHYAACPVCRELMYEIGIHHYYLAENAEQIFTRESVIKTTVKTVYVAGSLTNLPVGEAIAQKKLYEALGRAAEELGCRACIPHLHNGEDVKTVKDPKEVYRWAAQQVGTHDVTIAEVTYPSIGVGGELAIVHAAGKKIILLSRIGIALSSFAKGVPAVVYHVEYETPEQACRRVQNVLRQI